MSDLDDFFFHTIHVEPYLGQDADGADLYGQSVAIPCFVEETTRIVRTADGTQGTSTAQAYTAAGTSVPLDSRVLLPTGRPTQLMSLDRHDSGPLGLPDHVTLNLE